MPAVYVVSPSSSPLPFPRRRARAEQELRRRFRRVTFGPCWTGDGDGDARAASAPSRAQEISEAVAAGATLLLGATGGWTCNEVLPFVDFELIRERRAVVCGFSDVSALLVAIYARTGVEAIHGPTALPSYGEAGGIDDASHGHLLETLAGAEHEVPAPERSTGESRRWEELDDDRRARRPVGRWRCLREGTASGPLVAVNMDVLERLVGTSYMADLAGHVLLLDDVGESPGRMMSQLVHLRQAGVLDDVCALVFARFPDAAPAQRAAREAVLEEVAGWMSGPVVADVDFGHTAPMCSLPLGRCLRIQAHRGHVGLRLMARA